MLFSKFESTRIIKWNAKTSCKQINNRKIKMSSRYFVVFCYVECYCLLPLGNGYIIVNCKCYVCELVWVCVCFVSQWRKTMQFMRDRVLFIMKHSKDNRAAIFLECDGKESITAVTTSVFFVDVLIVASNATVSFSFFMSIERIWIAMGFLSHVRPSISDLSIETFKFYIVSKSYDFLFFFICWKKLYKLILWRLCL